MESRVDETIVGGPAGMESLWKSKAVGRHEKQEIAYLLVCYLDKNRTYTSQEIDAYIKENVRSDLLEKRGNAVDHLRRNMVENGFLERHPNGSAYWVSETFTTYDEHVDKERRTVLQAIENAPRSYPVCPICGRRIPKPDYPQHYDSTHSVSARWEQIMDRYLQT